MTMIYETKGKNQQTELIAVAQESLKSTGKIEFKHYKRGK